MFAAQVKLQCIYSSFTHSLCAVGTRLCMYMLVYAFISMLQLPASDLRAGFIPQLPQGSSFLLH